MSELRFPRLRRPDVSVVIVTLDALDELEQGLHALLDNTEPRYEVIVVDNDSRDGTPAFLEQIANATVVRNSRNYGFGVANNQGAAHARGRHLFFLNPDVHVEPGWLPPLLRRIDSDDRIGAVGPMVCSPDGLLESAGPLLSRSGSPANYGEGDRPDRPEYRLARVVDYLGGGCLLVRRRAFNEIGGFDPAYGLLYYEDVDLCLALGANGYRSIFEPGSSVMHRRSAPSEPLRLRALRNRGLLVRRWSRALASRPLAPLAASPRRILDAREAPGISWERREVLHGPPQADLTREPSTRPHSAVR
jgi:GT2 family glycosyltransferase